jgi:hypothetical protein
MNPTHTNPIVPVQRRSDGSIDYGYYDARARVARSGAFRATCRSVCLLCHKMIDACLGRRRHGQGATQVVNHVVEPAYPQTFVQNYAANAQQHRDWVSKAA